MDTKIIELRMSVQSLPTENKQVQLAIKAEVLRLAELLDKQLSNPTTGAVDDAEAEPYYDPDLPEEVAAHLEWQRTHRH